MCQTVSIVWTKIKEALKPKPKAEKEKERKKRRMMDEAKSYKTLTNMFSKTPISENEKNDFSSTCNALESLDTARVEKIKKTNEEIKSTSVNDSFKEVR